MKNSLTNKIRNTLLTGAASLILAAGCSTSDYFVGDWGKCETKLYSDSNTVKTFSGDEVKKMSIENLGRSPPYILDERGALTLSMHYKIKIRDGEDNLHEGHAVTINCRSNE